MKTNRGAHSVGPGANSLKGARRLLLSILISAIFLLGGCDKLRQLAQGPKIIKKQQREITSLNSKMHGLELQLAGLRHELQSQNINTAKKFTNLDSSLNSLGTKYAVLDSSINKYKVCIFNDAPKSAQRLDTNFGFMFVSLDKISTHGNSCKLILDIGDPYIYDISQFTLSLRYGKAFNPSGPDSYDDWLKSLKSINQPFKKHLKSGQWNKIEISLGNLQPDEVKYIAIKMTVDNIALGQNPDSGSARRPGK